jgi:hypothetical protein
VILPGHLTELELETSWTISSSRAMGEEEREYEEVISIGGL